MSKVFQNLYTVNLASILELPSNAVVVDNVVEEDAIVALTAVRTTVRAFRMTFTVTAMNTTIAALSSALVASQAPLNAILVNQGYNKVVLGTIGARDTKRPTLQPTFEPSSRSVSKKLAPYIIILIVVSILVLIVAVIATTLCCKPVWRERLLSKCLPSQCCQLPRFRSV